MLNEKTITIPDTLFEDMKRYMKGLQIAIDGCQENQSVGKTLHYVISAFNEEGRELIKTMDNIGDLT